MLERSSYDPPLYQQPHDERTPWTSAIADSPPFTEYEALMSTESGSNAAMLEVLDELVSVGEFPY